jgi:hypothetical protein
MVIRVLSVPRMPGVQTVQGLEPRALEPPALGVRQVESGVVDAIEAPAGDVEIDERGSD